MGVWICGACYSENAQDQKNCSKCGKASSQGGKISDKRELKRIRRRCSVCDKECDGEKCQRCRMDSLTTADGITQQVLRHNGIDSKEQRIVLIGKTGVGKSATANNIIQETCFKAKQSPKSVTEKCQYVRKERCNRNLLLIDTPGLFDNNKDKKEVENEIKKCIAISSPGPHVFLMVMSLTSRYTEEERRVFSEIGTMFGDHIIKYLIVIFTARDQLEDSVESHIDECPDELQRILRTAGGGYLTFNNKGNDSEKAEDVKNLFDRIEKVVQKNDGAHFTSKFFEEAETLITYRITRELEDKEDDIRKQIEETMRAEIEEMMEKAREEFQNRHEEELAEIEEMMNNMRKEREINEWEHKMKAERSLRELVKMEMECKEKQVMFRQQMKTASAALKVKLRNQLELIEEELVNIDERKKGAEEGIREERLNTMFMSRACAIRELERDKTQKEDEETISRLKVIKPTGQFLNLFKET